MPVPAAAAAAEDAAVAAAEVMAASLAAPSTLEEPAAPSSEGEAEMERDAASTDEPACEGGEEGASLLLALGAFAPAAPEEAPRRREVARAG